MADCEIWLGDTRSMAERLPDRGVNCLIADPPYGVDFVSRHATTPEGQKHVRPIAGDGDLKEAAQVFRGVMAALLPKLACELEMYVFTRWDILDTWIPLVKELSMFGIEYKMMLIWEKGYPGQGDIDANWGCGHEEILYLKRGRRDVPYRRSGIIAVDKLPSQKHIHPTEKPVALIEKLIEMSTDVGDLVVDPFAGSGSTVVAAQNLGRRAVGIEKETHYVNLARPRLAQRSLL